MFGKPEFVVVLAHVLAVCSRFIEGKCLDLEYELETH
jgi:hypothetical protein